MTNHQSLYEVMAETSRRADESAGYLPREQARTADVPEPDTWACIDSLIKPVATWGFVLFIVALLLALILSPYFLR